MDSVEFHRELPTNLPTMVVAFGGWIDAGEAVTGAMRHLVRHLSASHLASIDPEEFFDFTKVRPVVRLTAGLPVHRLVPSCRPERRSTITSWSCSSVAR